MTVCTMILVLCPYYSLMPLDSCVRNDQLYHHCVLCMCVYYMCGSLIAACWLVAMCQPPMAVTVSRRETCFNCTLNLTVQCVVTFYTGPRRTPVGITFDKPSSRSLCTVTSKKCCLQLNRVKLLQLLLPLRDTELMRLGV